MNWQAEIVQLHEFFQAWYDGAVESNSRMTDVLDDAFTLIGPNGHVLDRTATVELVSGARGRGGMTIRTENHELLWESDAALVARYDEVHTIGDESTRRVSTVVFTPNADTPNGLSWVTVHETWVE